MSNGSDNSVISNEKKYELVVSILHDLDIHLHNWIKLLVIINSSLCVAIFAILNKDFGFNQIIFKLLSISLPLIGILFTNYIKKLIIKNREWHYSYIHDLCSLEKNNPIVFVKGKNVGDNNEINSLKYQMDNLCDFIVLFWMVFIVLLIVIFIHTT